MADVKKISTFRNVPAPTNKLGALSKNVVDKKAREDAATMKAYSASVASPAQSSTGLTSPQGPRRRITAAEIKSMGLKKGGYVKTADGCAKKGKTKGRMV